METLWQDLRYAARRLRGSPGFALAVVLTLAVGIGANTAVFSIMDALVFKQLPVNHPEQLVGVFRGDQDSFSNPLWNSCAITKTFSQASLRGLNKTPTYLSTAKCSERAWPSSAANVFQPSA